MYFYVANDGPCAENLFDASVKDLIVGHRKFGFARFTDKTNIDDLNVTDTGKVAFNRLRRIFIFSSTLVNRVHCSAGVRACLSVIK